MFIVAYLLAFFEGNITKIGGLQDFASKFIYFLQALFVINMIVYFN